MSTMFIAEDELTAERTPDELVKWVDRKFQEIAQQEGGKEAVRMRTGLCKQLVEEVFPLSIFASFRFNGADDIALRSVIGNQNYDALITDHSLGETTRLEITQAHEGENEFLRRLMLQEKHWAPASGQISKTGTKKTGIKLKTSLVAKHVEDLLGEQKKLIEDALERKLRKEYESNTALLIMFEDVVSFNEKEEQEELYRFVDEELGPKAKPFSALYLASWSKRIFITWPRD